MYQYKNEFFRAIKNNEVDKVENIIRVLYKSQRLQEINNLKTELQWGPLHVACNEGNTRITKLFLIGDTISEINEMDQCGQTPLFLSCFWDHVGCVEHLLKDTRCDPNQVDSIGWTPIMIAANRRNEKTLDALIASGRFINMEHKSTEDDGQFEEGTTLLDILEKKKLNDYIPIVQHYIKDRVKTVNQFRNDLFNRMTEENKKKIPSNKLNIHPAEFFIYNCADGRIDEAKSQLLLCNALVNAQINDATALFASVSRNQLEIVQLLINQPALDTKNRKNTTQALIVEAKKRNASKTLRFLESVANNRGGWMS